MALLVYGSPSIDRDILLDSLQRLYISILGQIAEDTIDGWKKLTWILEKGAGKDLGQLLESGLLSCQKVESGDPLSSCNPIWNGRPRQQSFLTLLSQMIIIVLCEDYLKILADGKYDSLFSWVKASSPGLQWYSRHCTDTQFISEWNSKVLLWCIKAYMAWFYYLLDCLLQKRVCPPSNSPGCSTSCSLHLRETMA